MYEKFEKMLLKNPWRLSRSAQVLWHKLFYRTRFKNEDSISIEGASLARLMGATEKTFLAARAELEDQGLLDCVRGVKGNPSVYKLLDIKR